MTTFKEAFIRHRKEQDTDYRAQCDDCGPEAPDDDLEIQIRKPTEGFAAWEHEFDDAALICADCRGRITQVVSGYMDFLRQQPPHIMYEAHDLLDELRTTKNPKVAFARAKNAVRNLGFSNTY